MKSNRMAVAVLCVAVVALAAHTPLSRLLASKDITASAILHHRATGHRSSVPPIDTNEFYPVVRVVDGDTIDVDIAGESERIRMLGINTPETVDPRRPVECFGKEASREAHVLLDGKSVRIETDSSQGMFDKYGRMLAYVYLSDGTSFNKTMITEGYAHEYTYKLPYRYQAEYKAAEQDARQDDRGLWAPGVCG